jgi:hypothetical protein
MRTLALPAVLAVVGLSAIALVGGDPRAVSELGAATTIDLAAAALAIAVGAIAWLTGRRRTVWVLVPSVVLALVGGLCGWIAGAEFTLAPDTPVRLSTAPGRVAFMLAMTAVGMSLFPSLLVLLAGLGATPRDRART